MNCLLVTQSCISGGWLGGGRGGWAPGVQAPQLSALPLSRWDAGAGGERVSRRESDLPRSGEGGGEQLGY